MTEVIQNTHSSFRAVGEESHTREKSRFARDISLSLNMTKYFSHSVLDTESVSLMF